MASVTISTTTYEISSDLLDKVLLLSLMVCLLIVWRVYIIEKTKRIESEIEFKKAILKKIADVRVTEILRRELTTLQNKSWYSNWF